MVSATLAWFGVTKPVFVDKKLLKVNAKNYPTLLQKELFPAINKIRKDLDFNSR